MSALFERRWQRAEALRAQWPFADGLLRFFCGVYRLQSVIADELALSEPPEALLRFLPRLFELVDAEPLREPVGALRGYGADRWMEHVRAEVGPDRLVAAPTAESFFARVLVEPFLARGAVVAPTGSQAACPRCASPPLCSVLFEDADAAAVRRALVCARCAAQWDFPRVLCPACREESPEKLPRYTAEEIPWIRVEGCDACGVYLKAIDLTKNADAEAIVDELGSTPLDVIARERGYRKVVGNLVGV